MCLDRPAHASPGRNRLDARPCHYSLKIAIAWVQPAEARCALTGKQTMSNPPPAAPQIAQLRHPGSSRFPGIAAGSAGGISPPAAHRTVRKPLDLHGSSQPYPCHLAMTGDAEYERSSRFPVGAQILRAGSSSSLHTHYKRFVATTG